MDYNTVVTVLQRMMISVQQPTVFLVQTIKCDDTTNIAGLIIKFQINNR